MVMILEQAKQKMRNYPPIGADNSTLVYPGVNTCVTISIIPEKQGLLIGLHLGLMMGAGKEGGEGSEDSSLIDMTSLRWYLGTLKEEVNDQGSGVRKIYVAGALAVWEDTPGDQWKLIKETVNGWAHDWKSAVEYRPFDDSSAKTVDITVTGGGVTFTATDSGGEVKSSSKDLVS